MDPDVAIKICVECCPYDPDDKNPIRLILTGEDDVVVTELFFTPARAWDSAYSLGRLLGHFAPRADTHRVAQGLRTAAVRIWSIRT